MNLYDSNCGRALRDVVLQALVAGEAENLEEEAVFVLDHIAKNRVYQSQDIEDVLSALANGASPYHVLGYPIPDTDLTIHVPLMVMPPGIVTPRTILAIREQARECEVPLLVDIGCGSGVLGISALMACSNLKAVLIDVERAACEASRSNLARSGVMPRASVIRGDGLQCLSPNSVGIIVANLPFVPTQHINSLPRRFRVYARRTAVDGGTDGLMIFRALSAQMRRVLIQNGTLVLQVGDGQRDRILELLGSHWTLPAAAEKIDPNLIVVRRTDVH